MENVMTQKDDLNNMDSPETKPKRRRKSRALPDKIKRGYNISAGINEHLETLKPKGLNEESIGELTALIEKCEQLSNERNILQGELKEKTTKLHAATAELDNTLALHGAIVKSVLPKSQWVSFGITDKR